MDLKLKDKVVILTGGTGGIGEYIALDFLLEKAIVILLYRNEEKFTKVKKWLAENVEIEGRLFGIRTSITDKDQIKAVINTIAEKHSKIDVLVNCAGFATEAPFLLLDDDVIEQTVELNFMSPLFLSKAVLRYMLKNKSGNIVNITSVSARSWGRGITVYAAAKAALERFSKTLAQEVGKKNIRVNAVSPGVIETDMSTTLRSVGEHIILPGTAMRKYGKPHEVSKAVLFLASEETASFITGHVLNVDGGFQL